MTATAEGSLYELLARGNKDVYLFSEDSKSTFLFDSSYEAQAPLLTERRVVPPVSTAEFGRSVEFAFDLVGDLMKEPSILIKLPTWLPVTQAALNTKSIIKDNSGVTYGYTQAIAYFLFENIQFFQDNILLQEFSGDTLWALSKMSGSYSRRFLTMEETGDHDGTSSSIQKNATPPRLRLELPLIGCQAGEQGFPQRGAMRHTYRLRCKLRKLEDLVEASDKRQKPTPWNTAMTIQTVRETNDPPVLQPFTTLKREQIPPIELHLETTQVYVDNEMQQALEKIPTKVRFRRVFENTFTQSSLEYTSVVAGGISQVKRRIDGRHPTSRLIWYFRSTADILANRLYSVSTAQGQPYFNTVTLAIAGGQREAPQTPQVWRDLTNYAKEDCDSALELNTMNWTLGVTPRGRPEFDTSTGAVNFSTADKPTFFIDLANPGTATATTPQGGGGLQPTTTQLNIIQEGWAQFQTDGKGGAELFSFN
jgi:hypothetical protein